MKYLFKVQNATQIWINKWTEYSADYTAYSKQLTKTEDDFALLFNLNKRSLWLCVFALQPFSNQAIGQQFIRSSSIAYFLNRLAHSWLG